MSQPPPASSPSASGIGGSGLPEGVTPSVTGSPTGAGSSPGLGHRTRKARPASISFRRGGAADPTEPPPCPWDSHGSAAIFAVNRSRLGNRLKITALVNAVQALLTRVEEFRNCGSPQLRLVLHQSRGFGRLRRNETRPEKGSTPSDGQVNLAR